MQLPPPPPALRAPYDPHGFLPGHFTSADRDDAALLREAGYAPGFALLDQALLVCLPPPGGYGGPIPPGPRDDGPRYPTRRYAWGQELHRGGAFGTYEIALMAGFLPEQAGRIADADEAVDRGPTSEAHHWHFNRAPFGQEDTRLTNARTPLANALELAHGHHYDAAEQELGKGLHSLQDLTAHGQITPPCHLLLGSFPDVQALHPDGVAQARVLTEWYLDRYLDGLSPPRPLKLRLGEDPGYEAGTVTLRWWDPMAGLRHELAHALDDRKRDDKAWQAARAHQIYLARRARTTTNGHEIVAQILCLLAER